MNDVVVQIAASAPIHLKCVPPGLRFGLPILRYHKFHQVTAGPEAGFAHLATNLDETLPR